MTEHNHTEKTRAEISRYRLLKKVRSHWRRRTVELYEDPEDEMQVFSVGDSWDKDMSVICRENKSDWQRELSMDGAVVDTY